MNKNQTDQTRIILDALHLVLTEQARTQAMLDATHELIERLLPPTATTGATPHDVFVTTMGNAIDRNFQRRMADLEIAVKEIETSFLGSAE